MAVKHSLKSQRDAAKASLRGECTALNALIREEGRQKLMILFKIKELEEKQSKNKHNGMK